MPIGMDAEEIESRVVQELSKRPGHVERLNSYQLEIIARAVATVITENNESLEKSLGEAGVDLK